MRRCIHTRVRSYFERTLYPSDITAPRVISRWYRYTASFPCSATARSTKESHSLTSSSRCYCSSPIRWTTSPDNNLSCRRLTSRLNSCGRSLSSAQIHHASQGMAQYGPTTTESRLTMPILLSMHSPRIIPVSVNGDIVL